MLTQLAHVPATAACSSQLSAVMMLADGSLTSLLPVLNPDFFAKHVPIAIFSNYQLK